MEQIVDWLEKLGMSEYRQRFADNGIGIAALRHLTDEDLKEIGVLLGHRRIMLAAIAELARPAESAVQPVVGVEPQLRSGAERRHVTVMFSDLVGSTALSARMDPEDLREVISAYQNCVAETVHRFGGFVAKYMGDGVLVYFGYPEAHEDDAERSVRAGLEAVASVGRLKTSVPLQTRVGIATGLVVVGDLIGSGEAQERGIIGETPNLAARLQSIAEPNTVVIAESTRRLVGGLFELENVGRKALKGISESVPVWAALRSSAAESRFDALRGSQLTALVGREEELELLVQRWSKAKAGEGQVVLLSGEAGIGKSRLAAALLERLADEPHTRLRYFCSPQHTDSALYPIIGQMERAAGFRHDDTPQVRCDKLDALLAQTSTSTEYVALLADMLSLPNDGRYPALELTPQGRRARTLEALVAQLIALPRKNPVLMIVEDTHWIDPTSLEAFGRLMDRILTLPVLLIVTFRPEFDPPWIGQPCVTALTINRLTQRDVGTLINHVVANKPLPANVQQDIIERTDGIPLFVEEMTKAVLEAESEGEAQQAVAALPSPALAVPASLHASLMARLDRLGPAKKVAEIGSAIGREFSHVILSATVSMSEAELLPALNSLVATGLLLRQGVPPHATYLFKHALVQDAAYGTLLREPRRALHARIAEALETEFPEIVESQPEILARHYTEAGLVEKAVGLWGKAGQRSLARSALVEGIAQLTRSLDLMATLASTPALRREQIELQVALISPLIHVKGHSSPEVKSATEQARLLIEHAEALGEPPENPLLLYSVLYGFWSTNVLMMNGDALCTLAAQFLALAEKQGATTPLMIGHQLVGYSSLLTGNLVHGRRHLDLAIALYDPAVHRPLGALFGMDVRVSSLSYRALLSWCLGYPEAALADMHQSLKEARGIGQAGTLLNALNWACVMHFLCGTYADGEAAANELVTLAGEKGALAVWKPAGLLYRGWLLGALRRPSEAIQLLAPGLAKYRSAGLTCLAPVGLSILGKSYAAVGQFDDARHSVDEATKLVERTREAWFEAGVYLSAGEVALMSPQSDVAKAEAHFERALTVACEQQAKSWELRATMSLARLWRDQDKVQQARELLAPVYGWFTEGFDTRDLREAEALLNELSS